MADPRIEAFKRFALAQAALQAPQNAVSDMASVPDLPQAYSPQVNPQAQPTTAPQAVQSQPGPIKSFLSNFLYGTGQALNAHVGLETDAQKQQREFGQQQAIQNATAQNQLRQAQIAALDSQNEQQNLGDYIPGMQGTAARKDIPKLIAAHISALSGEKKATTAAGARTDAAQITADARRDVAQTNADVRDLVSQRQYGQAAQRLKLAGSNLSLRQLEYNLRAYGTGADGQPVPGTLFDTNGRPIGTAMGANVRPTSTSRAAGERAETMQDLEARIRGALNDPEIASQLGPVQGRINELKNNAGILDGPVAELYNDLKSYGAFQAGLHPVRGIGGLQYFEKVMGGLGQTPEELLGKLGSNRATASSVIGVAHTGVNPRSATAAPSGAKATHRFNPTTGKIEAIQ